MDFETVSTEDPSIDLSRRAYPRLAFLMRAADKLQWRLSRDGDIEEGSGDVIVAPDEIIISDFGSREHAEMRSKASIRPDGFFRLSMRELVDDLGLQEESATESLKILDPMLRRCVNMFEAAALRLDAHDAFGQAFRNWKMSQFFTEHGIVANGFRGFDQAEAPNRFQATLQSYLAGASSRAAAKAPPRELFNFRRPALTTLRTVLDQFVPTGDWRALNKDVTDETFQQILESKLPAMFNFSWAPRPRRGVSERQMLAVLRYLGWENLRDGPRDWATMEETLVLRAVVDLKIRYAFLAERWIKPGFAEAFLEPLTAREPYWCVDLVAQNLLVSMTTRNSAPISPSILSVWTTARDRIAMMPLAQRFADHGFPVVFSYLGGLLTHCPPARREEAIKLAWGMGLTPPLSLSSQRKDDAPRVQGDEIDGVKWGGEAELLPYAICRAEGDLDGLLAAEGFIQDDDG